MITPKAYKLISALRELDDKEKYEIAKEIVNNRLVDIGILLVLYINNLQHERDDAANDIVRVAEAGATLAEKSVKEAAGVKSRARRLTPYMRLALTRCLLEAGAHYGSQYGKQLRQSIDTSEIDEEWYKHSWQPRSKVYPIKDNPNHAPTKY